MKKNWFFIITLAIAALLLSGTAAYFSVFGLTQLFYAAGIGITILAASLEFAKIVTVSYVYRFWNIIEKGLRGFYVFAVVFIMFLTSMGIYGFLTSAYQKSANKIELRDSKIKISENKRTLFINQLDRVNKSIESSSERINTISGLRGQQEKRLDNLYNQKYIGVAKRTEQQITGSDDQIKLLNDDITSKMQQTNIINDSISFYDQKIAELKSSSVSDEIGSYQFISELTGIPMNKVVNIVVILIILVFDPLAIGLLIGLNKLTMNKLEDEKEEKESLLNRIRRKFKKKYKVKTEPVVQEQKIVEIEEIIPTQEEIIPTQEEIIPTQEEIILTEEQTEEENISTQEEQTILIIPQKIEEKIESEFEPQRIASVRSNVNIAHFVPKN
jgi:hypothetical protein